MAWSFVCDEGSQFTVTGGPKDYRLGKNTSWTANKTLQDGTYTANLALFGADPLPNVLKEVDVSDGAAQTQFPVNFTVNINGVQYSGTGTAQ